MQGEGRSKQGEAHAAVQHVHGLRVRIRNRQHLAVEGQGTVAIKSCAWIKLVYDVMYVPEIDQNLLSVG